MSEQVTVIVQGKFHEGDSFDKRFLTADKGENLLRLLKRNGYYAADCSGNGACGKCVVRYGQNAPLPTTNERTFLCAEQLRDGYRLACRHVLMQDTEIVLHVPVRKLPDIVIDAAGDMSLKDERSQTGVGLAEPADGVSYEAAGMVFCVADIGTTTVVMQFVSGSDVLGTYTALNPQRNFGADVASRISAAEQGHLEEMSKVIRQCLEEGIVTLAKQCATVPEFVVVVGNTAMNYLLRAVSTKALGRYPFRPVDTEVVQLELQGIRGYLLPGISAFVGGDVVAGIHAFDMMQTAQIQDGQALDGRVCTVPVETGQIQLLVDLGTNGEIVLSRNGKLFCTATAAGPAFESGVSGALMGADLIRAVAKLLEQGIVDETGLVQEPYFTHGIVVDGVTVKQADIRELQKAKAAVALGIELLCERAGIDVLQIEMIYLAGGFGYYLNPESAIRIGIFPECFREKVRAVGNSALLGAKHLGKLLAECKAEDRMTVLQKECEQIQASCRSMNLAEETDFAQKYVERLSFPERA